MPGVNWIFLGLIVISVVTAAFTGTMPRVTEASLSSAKSAVELAVSLIGQMTLWLGLVGILREAGLMQSLSRLLRPVLARLFPDVPIDHPAMGAMIMNFAANLLGLGNAATPFGLKAMQELDTLNKQKGVATNAMALFLVFNTAGLTILPVTVMAVRSSLGSHDPAGIIVPTLIATIVSTIISVAVCKLLEKRKIFDRADVVVDLGERKTLDLAAFEKAQATAAITREVPLWRLLVTAGIASAVVFGLVRHVIASPDATKLEMTRDILSGWLLPILILSMVLVGFSRQVKVYEAFIASAKDGFQTVVTIIPFLVGLLVSIGMFRACGAMEVLVNILSPLVAPIGFPPEALPMVLIRPLSGSGAAGLMAEIMKTHGPDSFIGYVVSVLNGSTETTFYVLALYFGAVQVKVLRHTLVACLVSDVVGPLSGFLACRFFFA